jgi:hypothetical protein
MAAVKLSRYRTNLDAQARQKWIENQKNAKKGGYVPIAMDLAKFKVWYRDKKTTVHACEWCKRPFPANGKTNARAVVGHDHVSGDPHYVCNACNVIEGQAQGNPEHLERIAEVLRAIAQGRYGPVAT